MVKDIKNIFTSMLVFHIGSLGTLKGKAIQNIPESRGFQKFCITAYLNPPLIKTIDYTYKSLVNAEHISRSSDKFNSTIEAVSAEK